MLALSAVDGACDMVMNFGGGLVLESLPLYMVRVLGMEMGHCPTKGVGPNRGPRPMLHWRTLRRLRTPNHIGHDSSFPNTSREVWNIPGTTFRRIYQGARVGLHSG